MPEAISDTGPILHLHEIDRLDTLGVFDRLIIPGMVAGELSLYGLEDATLSTLGVRISVVPVSTASRQDIMVGDGPLIHPADAEVFVLAEGNGFQIPVLTDDLALRRRLEARGAVVVGSIGVLVRAYRTGRLTRPELESAVDALFTVSTLRLSRAFRAYVRQLLADLP